MLRLAGTPYTFLYYMTVKYLSIRSHPIAESALFKWFYFKLLKIVRFTCSIQNHNKILKKKFKIQNEKLNFIH